jgi:hypothetical protein
MKKIGFWGLTALLVLGLTVSGAQAFSFLDTTEVERWQGQVGSGVWENFIDPSPTGTTFNTFGADLVGNKFKITTNWNPGKNGVINALVKTADFFIDKGNDGSWDLAVRVNTTLGPVSAIVFNNLTPQDIQTSRDIFGGTNNLIYGGKYDKALPKDVPVWATGSNTSSTPVTWVYGASNLNNTVEIDLAGLGLTGPWGFVWGTATCGNDGFSGVVPVPASVLLLGTGLLGLVGVGLRKKS